MSILYPYGVLTSYKKLEKTNGGSEIFKDGLTDGLTDRQTDRGDYT